MVDEAALEMVTQLLLGHALGAPSYAVVGGAGRYESGFVEATVPESHMELRCTVANEHN